MTLQDNTSPDNTSPGNTSPDNTRSLSSRVKLLDYEMAKLKANEVEVMDVMCKLNIFKALLNYKELAGAINKLIFTLLFEGKLSHRERELIILRVGWQRKSDYEWTQHYTIAKNFGVDEGSIVALRDWENSDKFSEKERILLLATDEVLDLGFITEATFNSLKSFYRDSDNEDGIMIEIVSVIGVWQLVATILLSLDIKLEEDIVSWPPEGIR